MIALLKLGVVFVGIVTLLTYKWNLGLVLLLASLVVGMLFAHPVAEIGRDIWRATIDVLTLRLALAVVLIMTLSELLRQTSGLKGMVQALQALVSHGPLVLATLPAVVGLLPMVGGAMFSAPMVDEVGDRLGVDRERKTFVNYWFRHIWEVVFPLYPSMMLGAVLLGLTPLELARATWPLTLAAVIAGLLFGLRGVARHGQDDAAPAARSQYLRLLGTSTWPIVLVILLPVMLPVDERFSLILGLLVTIAALMAVKHVPPRDLVAIFRERIPWKTVVVIFGALIFRRVLESSGAVVATSDALTQMHIPLAAVAFAVPFIAGLLTGLTAAAFSIGFPVVVPLVASEGGTVGLAWGAWLMAGGYLGVMLSPVHLCLALTRVYFQARWGPIYRRMAPATILVGATAGALLLLSAG